MEKFVQITPVVMEGYPDACNVWLKVENQKFMISPHSCETRGEAEWLRDMLCIALARVAADRVTTPAQAAPDLHALVDWVYLYALEGEAWPDRKTIADPLIRLAGERAPTQEDADRFKAGEGLREAARPPAAPVSPSSAGTEDGK